jgi:hypothetical protein
MRSVSNLPMMMYRSVGADTGIGAGIGTGAGA